MSSVTADQASIKELPKSFRTPQFKFSDRISRLLPNTRTVRPSPEVAQAWSLSFTNMMKSNYGKSLFRTFLVQEFSEENVDFWLAVEKYKTCKKKRLVAKAKKIFENFIITEAPNEVNLVSSMKSSLAVEILIPSHTTFDAPQKIIQTIMEAGGYSRFLESELYLELVYPNKMEGNVDGHH